MNKFNLTNEEMINEMLYHYHHEDIQNKYRIDLNNEVIDTESLICAFNLFLQEHSNYETVENIYNNSKNDYILIDTPDGYCQLTDFYKKNKQKCLEIKTLNNTCKSSSKHLYQRYNGDWSYADSLNPGEYLLTKTGEDCIISIDELEDSIVYDFTVNHLNQRYWGGTGISSHNTGKSFLALNYCKGAVDMGYSILYIDTEGTVNLDLIENFGIDTTKFRLENKLTTVEEFKIYMAKFLKKLEEVKAAGKAIPKMLIVVDSIGNFPSEKEINDAEAGENKQDMTRNKVMKSLFRIITAKLSNLGIGIIGVGHTYECVTGDTEVLMYDNTSKQIKDIKQGDFVKTLSGDKEVNFIKKYDNAKIVKLTLEDGTEIKCTGNHKFLIKPEWSENEEDSCWINAEDLKESDIILQVNI